MGLIEAILLGFQFDKLQKPLVFISMLIGLILFSIFGIGMIWALIDSLLNTEKELSSEFIIPILSLVIISLLFFSLAAVCGHFIKRCFE